MISKVQLYVNNTKKKALTLSRAVRQQLLSHGYEIMEDGKEEPDLVIGFGGDGTLLKWLSTRNYHTSAKYIGVHCGTLGFMQDFSVSDVEKFVSDIPQYVEQRLNFVFMELTTKDKTSHYYALNEFEILDSEDKTLRASNDIENEHLQKYAGTGMIICTPTGSTAHNFSSIGSIIYPGIEAIGMTPIEPLNNNKSRSLLRSMIIPKGHEIIMKSMSKDRIKIIADGRRIYEGEYVKLGVSYSDSYMTILTDPQNTFIKKIREKLI